MCAYDFTTRPDRLKQHTVKWQASENEPDLLQMWVADMDFLPQPDVRQALMDYASTHVFGYAYAPHSLYQAVIDWERDQHGYETTAEKIIFVDGVVPAIALAIQALTQEGDAILINSPVYPPFAKTISQNKRKLVRNSLIEVDGHFEIDFDRLEQDLITHEVKLYVLCSPHNPGGRVWTRAELERVGELCRKHGVILVADEIHQDLTLYGHKHVSFNTIKPEFKTFSIILASATKTFNIAGTSNSFVIIENDELRQAFRKQQHINNQYIVPTVGYIATEAALRYGSAWLGELKTVLEANIDYLQATFEAKTQIKVMKPQGTYLVWLDFSAYGLDDKALDTKLKQEAKVVLNAGITFGREGRGHMRFNTAAPFSLIKQAVDQIAFVFGK